MEHFSMTRILINKNTGSLVENQQFDINIVDLESEYTKKVDNSINELQSEDTTLYLDKDENQLDEDTINQFLSDYETTKVIMTDDQIIDFYETVQNDVPLSYLQGSNIKSSIFDVKNSQGILITNKNNLTNKRQYVYLNRQNFNDPHTYTSWIKPNSKNFKRKTLFRNELVFTVEGQKLEIDDGKVILK